MGTANGTTVHEAILDENRYQREVTTMGDSLGVSIPAEKCSDHEITSDTDVAIEWSETEDGYQRMEVVFGKGE